MDGNCAMRCDGLSQQVARVMNRALVVVVKDLSVFVIFPITTPLWARVHSFLPVKCRKTPRVGPRAPWAKA